MPRLARGAYLNPSEVQVIHALQRCVRRAFLCGEDQGKSFEHRRTSLKGFLSMPLTKYLELLDGTDRQLRSGKRGTIPAELVPILERLGLDTAGWCNLVQKFGKLFKRAAGAAESLSTEAARRGQRYLQAPGASLLTVGSG